MSTAACDPSTPNLPPNEGRLNYVSGRHVSSLANGIYSRRKSTADSPVIIPDKSHLNVQDNYLKLINRNFHFIVKTTTE